MKKWILIGLMGLPCVAHAEEIPVAIDSTTVSTDSWRSVPHTAFGAPEECLFAVRFGIITAGSAHISVVGVEPMEGREAYHLVSEAKSTGLASLIYPVTDRNDTWLDTQSLSTLKYSKKIRERHYRIEEEVVLDQVHHRYTASSYRVDKNNFEIMHGNLPPYALDVLGSFFYVRTLPLVVGQSTTMDVISGDKVWPLLMTVKKRETIKVPAGKFDCFRVEPILREHGLFIAKAKKLEVWLTADDQHIPVQMRAEIFVGHVSAVLRKYHSPTRHYPASKAP